MSLGFVDKRRGRLSMGQAAVLGTPGNYANVASMRTRLTAIDSTYFSTAKLNQMTENDMTYALRQADDAAGIK